MFGIHCDKSTLDLFDSVSADENFRAARIDINNGTLSVPPETIIKPSSPASDESDTSDFSLLPQLLLDGTSPLYILYRLHTGVCYLISFVPESSKVKAKVIHSSARPALLKALPVGLIKSTIFACSLAELTPTGYKAYIRNAELPPPLTETERFDKEADEEAAADAARVRAAVKAAASSGAGGGGLMAAMMAGSGPGPRGKMASGQQMDLSDDVIADMNTIADSKEADNALVLHIQDEKLCTLSRSGVPLSGVAALIPLKTPSFSFVRVPHGRKILFVYTCPQGSPVRMRMQFSSQAGPLPRAAQDKSNIVIAAKVETDDPTELTEEYISSEVGPEDLEPEVLAEEEPKVADEIESEQSQSPVTGNVVSDEPSDTDKKDASISDKALDSAAVSPAVATPTSANKVRPVVPPKRSESTGSATSANFPTEQADTGVQSLKLASHEEDEEKRTEGL